jgi:hypothetical protein
LFCFGKGGETEIWDHGIRGHYGVHGPHKAMRSPPANCPLRLLGSLEYFDLDICHTKLEYRSWQGTAIPTLAFERIAMHLSVACLKYYQLLIKYVKKH